MHGRCEQPSGEPRVILVGHGYHPASPKTKKAIFNHVQRDLLLNERTTYNCWNVSSAVDVLPLGRIVTACLVKRGEGRKKRSIHTSLALSQSGTLYRQIKKNNNNNLIVSNVLFLNLTKNGAERVLTLAPSMCFTTHLIHALLIQSHIPFVGHATSNMYYIIQHGFAVYSVI